MGVSACAYYTTLNFPVIYIIYTRAGGRADETRTDGANAGDSIIYMYVLPRVRVSVAQFPRDIMRSYRWRVSACRACYCIYVYRYIVIGLRLFCWRARSRSVPSAVGVACCSARAGLRCCLSLLLYGVIVL